MKILMLNYEFPPLGGGASNATKYLLKEFSSKPNIKVDLVTSSAINKMDVEKFSDNINIYKLPINKKKSWEGSTTFFLTSLLVLLFFLNPLRALIIAAIVTFVEMLPKAEDNITVPLSTGLLMFFL